MAASDSTPPRSTRPHLAVVVVTYDSERFVDRCFAALAAADRTGLGVRVLVVDNGSHDGTVARIRASHPEVTVIETGANLGFAAGNNVGIERALAEGAEYVFLLNPDTEPTPGFLREALAVLDQHPRAGAVQSLLLLGSEKDRINTAGNVAHFLGFGYCGLYRAPREAAPEHPVEIAFSSGAAALIRAEALRAAGLFDPDLFLYHEDFDLGWRIRLAGYDHLLAPRSVVLHHYEFSRNPAKFYYLERNRYLLLLKNFSVRSLLVLAPALIAVELPLLVMAAKGGWLPAKLRAMAQLLRPRTWRHVSRERARVAALRRRPDADVMAILRSDLSFEGITSPFMRDVANPLMGATWRLLRRALG